MAENKTKLTKADVGLYLAQIADAGRHQDGVALAALMTKVSKHSPKM